MIKTCILRIDYLLELLVLEDQSICICMIDGNWLLSANLFCKNLLTQVVQDIILDSALYRTGTKLWVVSYLCQILDSCRSCLLYTSDAADEL